MTQTVKQSFRRAAAAALCVMLCCMAVLSAFAAGGDPVDPVWSGATATWQPPAKPVSYYMIALYKDSSYLSDYTTSEVSYDFSDTVKNAGPGDYVFCVCAVFDDTSLSAIVYSDTFAYKGAGHPHPFHYVGFSYPTCTANGVKEHYECPVCDKYYWDPMGNNEIADKNEVVIPATGHAWDEWQITKNPTVDAEGESRRVCRNDSNHVEIKILPKLPSESATVTTPPATTAPVTTAPATTKPAETTKPKETTQPTTAAATAKVEESTAVYVSDGTFPMTIGRGGNTGSKNGSDGFPWMWVIIIGAAVLLLGAAPAVVIPIILVTRKKNQRPVPPYGQPPRMNGSEYLPPQNRNNPPRR